MNKRILKRIILFLIIFILFTIAALKGFLKPLDMTLGKYLLKLGETGYGNFFIFFRHLGDAKVGYIILLVISISAYLYKKINLKIFAYYTLIIFLILVMGGWELKRYTNRQRPSKIDYLASYEGRIQSDLGRYAYPSGHASRTTYILLALGYFISKITTRRLIKTASKVALYTAILLVGISSVGIGVHWVSDIIGAYILAYCFYLILLFIISTAPLPT